MSALVLTPASLAADGSLALPPMSSRSDETSRRHKRARAALTAAAVRLSEARRSGDPAAIVHAMEAFAEAKRESSDAHFMVLLAPGRRQALRERIAALPESSADRRRLERSSGILDEAAVELGALESSAPTPIPGDADAVLETGSEVRPLFWYEGRLRDAHGREVALPVRFYAPGGHSPEGRLTLRDGLTFESMVTIDAIGAIEIDSRVTDDAGDASPG